MRSLHAIVVTRSDAHRWLDAGLDGATRFRERVRLSWEAIVAVMVAVAGVALSAIAFAGIWEDVAEGDGLVLSDGPLLRGIVDHRSAWLVAVARVVTQFGSVTALIPLAVAISFGLWWRGQRVAVALAPSASLAVTAAVVAVTKVIVGRARPPAGWELMSERDASFPSGHTGDSTALSLAFGIVLAVVVLRRPLARLAAMVVGALVPVAIGSSRLVLAVHWPTDVLAGFMVGTIGAVIVTALLLVLAVREPPPVAGQAGSRGQSAAPMKAESWCGRSQTLLLSRRPSPIASASSPTATAPPAGER